MDVLLRFVGDPRSAVHASRALRAEIVGVGQAAHGTQGGFAAMTGAIASRAFTVATAGAAALGGAVAWTGARFLDLKDRARIAFTTMLGSGRAALQLLDDLARLARRTPFELPQLIELAQKLKAAGFEGKELIPVIRTLGDAVAGVGGSPEKLDAAVLALQQMKAQGKATSGDMRQLSTLGLPAVRLVAEQLGVTTAEVFRLMRAGRLDSDTAIRALLRGMAGEYGGLMEQQSRTASGMASNIKDAFSQLSGRIMAPTFALIKRGLEGIVDGSESADARVNALADRMGAAIARTLVSIVKSFRANRAEIVDTLGETWEATKDIAGALRTLAGAADGVSDGLGGWDETLRFILSAAVASRVLGLAGGLTRLAGAGEGGLAAGLGRLARFKTILLRLARFSVITILLDLWLSGQLERWLDQANAWANRVTGAGIPFYPGGLFGGDFDPRDVNLGIAGGAVAGGDFERTPAPPSGRRDQQPSTLGQLPLAPRPDGTGTDTKDNPLIPHRLRLKLAEAEATKTVRDDIRALEEIQTLLRRRKRAAKDVAEKADIQEELNSINERLADLRGELAEERSRHTAASRLRNSFAGLKKQLEDLLQAGVFGDTAAKQVKQKLAAFAKTLRTAFADGVITDTELERIRERFDELTEIASDGLDRFRDKVETSLGDARDSLGDVFGQLAGRLARLFEAQTDRMLQAVRVKIKTLAGEIELGIGEETPAQRALREMRDARRLEADARRRAELHAQIAAAEGEERERLLRELAEMEADERERALEEQAQLEQDARDAAIEAEQQRIRQQRDELRDGFDRALDEIRDKLADGELTTDEAMAAITDVIRTYGIPMQDAGALLGQAFAEGLETAMKRVEAALERMAKLLLAAALAAAGDIAGANRILDEALGSVASSIESAIGPPRKPVLMPEDVFSFASVAAVRNTHRRLAPATAAARGLSATAVAPGPAHVRIGEITFRGNTTLERPGKIASELRRLLKARHG